MAPLSLPITNALLGNGYTAAVEVGTGRIPMNLIVDTGSSSLVVEGRRYAAAEDGARTPTTLAQAVEYGAGWWAGAVVQTEVALAGADGAYVLEDVAVAVTTRESAHGFGAADGILGLAYASVDTAYDLGAPTWPTFDVQALERGRQVQVEPLFKRLEGTGLFARTFALHTLRSNARRTASGAYADDPLNRGLLILGGGPERTDLFSGPFQSVRVMEDRLFDTNLTGIHVGDRPLIPVAPPPEAHPRASNSFVDSGLDALLLPPALGRQVFRQFGEVNPELANAIAYAHHHGSAALNEADLQRWPDVMLVLEGTAGDVVLDVAPATYWQLEAAGDGGATFMIRTARGVEQAILGLPLLNNYFCVFDRSAEGGRGAIELAPIARPAEAST